MINHMSTVYQTALLSVWCSGHSINIHLVIWHTYSSPPVIPTVHCFYRKEVCVLRGTQPTTDKFSGPFRVRL